MTDHSPTRHPQAAIPRLYSEILEGTVTKDFLPRLSELYAEDVHFRDPFKDLRGFDALHEYYADFAELGEGGEFRIDRWIESAAAADAGEAALVWTLCLKDWEKEPEKRCFGGMSHIEWEEKIVHQRDYFDAGEAVYEQVPGLHWLHQRIKNRF